MTALLSGIPGKLKTVLRGESWLDISLYLLFISFFIAPFVDSLATRLLVSLLFSLMMIAGVISMSRRPAIRLAAGMIACTAISLSWLKHLMPTPAIVRLGTLAVLLFMVMLTLVTLVKVFGQGQVTTHRIKGAIAVYLLFGMAWGLLYGLLDQSLPNAFNLPPLGGNFTPERQETLTYFSFVTLTTLGYGDITPTHEIARMFVVIEGLIGQLYPATLLARLVSLEVMHREKQPDTA